MKQLLKLRICAFVFIQFSLLNLSAQTADYYSDDINIPLKEYSIDGGIYVTYFRDAQKSVIGKNTEYTFKKTNADKLVLISGRLLINRDIYCIDPKQLTETLKKDFEVLGNYTVTDISISITDDMFFSPKAFRLKGMFKANQNEEFERVLTAYNLSTSLVIIDLVYPKRNGFDYYKRFLTRFDRKKLAVGETGISVSVPIHYKIEKEEPSGYYYLLPCDRYSQENLQLILKDFSYPDNNEAEIDKVTTPSNSNAKQITGYSTALKLFQDTKAAIKMDPLVSNVTDIEPEKERFDLPQEIYGIRYFKKINQQNYDFTHYFVRSGKKVVSAIIYGRSDLPEKVVDHMDKLEDIINSISTIK